MRRVFVGACLVLGSIALQGCGVCSMMMISTSEERESANRPMEPVAVTALTAWEIGEDQLEVAVLYEDGVVRRTEWLLHERPVWTEGHHEDVLVDPEAEDALAHADALAAAGRWTEAVAALDRLLTSGADRVVRRGGRLVLVRDAARRRLRSLPPPGQRAYDLAHADRARGLLEAAGRTGETAALERILARHPGSAAVPEATRLLVGRLVEEGRAADALPHVERVLGASPPGSRDRQRLERLRASVRSLMGDGTDRPEVPVWLPLEPEPGWPAARPVALSGRRGLVLRHEQLRLHAADGELRAVLDLRRQIPRREPRTLAEQGSRAARAALWALFFPVCVAVDLVTWPLQVAGVLLYIGLSADG